MWLLYDLTILLYGIAIRFTALFNPKARQWVRGRRHQSAPTLDPSPNWERERPGLRQAREGALIWFHCASLGEFEQGRPVIEAFRQQYPDWKILLTFFSPSGYEIRKDYDVADEVLYLPLDTRKNARRFLEAYHPTLAVFVKYEFWFRYLDRLYKEKIPFYIISGIFRPQQHFFRWYGSWARKQLKKFTHLFLQDNNSMNLLQRNGIQNVTVSGDTRFDRVAEIAKNTKAFPLVEKFTRGRKTLLAGSTWPQDEELIMDIMEKFEDDVRFILAPHEVGQQRTEALVEQIVSHQLSEAKSATGGSPVVRSNVSETRNKKPAGHHAQDNSKPVVLFSQLTPETATATHALIVDGMGYLSHLYQYASVAYIGGGFGAGIHNILEAATFGKPIIIGPKYEKFREAVELVKAGGAFSVKNKEELVQVMTKLLNNREAYASASAKCRDYIEQNRGATEIILNGLKIK